MGSCLALVLARGSERGLSGEGVNPLPAEEVILIIWEGIVVANWRDILHCLFEVEMSADVRQPDARILGFGRGGELLADLH